MCISYVHFYNIIYQYWLSIYLHTTPNQTSIICSRIRSHISNVDRYLPNIVQQSPLDWKELSPQLIVEWCISSAYDLATCCRDHPRRVNCLCWLSIYNRPCIIAIPSINRVFSNDDMHHVCAIVSTLSIVISKCVNCECI